MLLFRVPNHCFIGNWQVAQVEVQVAQVSSRDRVKRVPFVADSALELNLLLTSLEIAFPASDTLDWKYKGRRLTACGSIIDQLVIN